MRFKRVPTTIAIALPEVWDLASLPLNRDPAMAAASLATGPLGEAILFHLLAPRNKIKPAYAALSALGSGLQAEMGRWLRIDPVELLVDAGNICLVGRDHLLLDTQESSLLLASLNSLLQEDNLIIQMGAPAEWYLQTFEQHQLTTFPWFEAMAKDIKAYLPSGVQKKKWHRLITELQMLLFDHPVNANRQKTRRPVANSVWLWGEGSILKEYTLQDYTGIWSSHSIVKGLLYQTGKHHLLQSPQAFTVGEVLDIPGNYLITLSHQEISIPAIHNTIALLFEAVAQRKIQQLSIHLGKGAIYIWHARSKTFFSGLLNWN